MRRDKGVRATVKKMAREHRCTREELLQALFFPKVNQDCWSTFSFPLLWAISAVILR